MQESRPASGESGIRLIDQLRVARKQGGDRDAVIELLAGDLSALPPQHAVDALVVSAFPNSYTPNAGTLFASLHERGLDMQLVARHKAEDERPHLGCWLSQPLPAEVVDRLRFQRVLCFEPRYPGFAERAGIAQGDVEAGVGFVFRCLNHFVIPDQRERRRFAIGSVAMPLLATGNQGVPLEKLFPRLLEAAIFWLEQGLPLQRLKIVAFHPADVAMAERIFAQLKANRGASGETGAGGERDTASEGAGESWREQLAREIGQLVVDRCERRFREQLMSVASGDEKALLQTLFAGSAQASRPAAAASALDGETKADEFDVFVSYAHKQDAEVAEFVRALQHREPGARVFYDRQSIAHGEQWIRRLSDAVQKSRCFVAILSPDYSASPVCWDEFQCAKLKEYNTRQALIRTVRLYRDPGLPLVMALHSYADCTEGDLQRLREVAERLLEQG